MKKNEKKVNIDNSSSMMLEKLTDIQHNLMLNPMDNSLWMQEVILQDQIQNLATEQELCWAQRSRQICFKRKNFIQKVIDEHGIVPRTKMFFAGLSNEINRRFKKDPMVALQLTITQSKDICSLDNQWLPLEATEEEILQAMKQISPLKVPGVDSMYVILYQKC